MWPHVLCMNTEASGLDPARYSSSSEVVTGQKHLSVQQHGATRICLLLSWAGSCAIDFRFMIYVYIYIYTYDRRARTTRQINGAKPPLRAFCDSLAAHNTTEEILLLYIYTYQRRILAICQVQARAEFVFRLHGPSLESEYARILCMRACVHARVHACMRACVHACVLAFMHACLRAFMRACMRACAHACMPAGVLRACVHACVMHAHVRVWTQHRS